MILNISTKDVESIEESFVHHVEYTLAQSRVNLTPYFSFKACALRYFKKQTNYNIT